jgi:soluble lytic murein transglycosylase
LHFVENNLENLDHQLAAERLYYFTKALVRRDLTIEVDKVIPLFLKIKDNNYNELIVFERLWLDWVKGDYKSAYNLIKKQNLISRIPEISDSKLKFWLIWTLIKLKNKNGFALANGFVLDNPLSYYSIILHNFNPDTVNSPFRIIQANKALNLVTPFTELPIKLQNQLRRYSVFSKLGNLTFMSLETDNMFKNFDSRFHSDIYAYQIWSHVNHKNNLEVFKTVSNALKSNNITLNQGVLKLIFPLSYLETIKVYNKKVDPYLILSLIRQESVFNPQAVSRVGALGLMQLMPTTAKRYEKDVSRNNLFKPNQNIRIGSKYFEGLMKMFNDNAILSLAAYNAGEGRVKRWLTEYFNTDSMLETIEQIPFSETQGYVKLISRNLYFYKSLYQDKEIELAAKREDKNSIYDVAMWTTTIR